MDCVLYDIDGDGEMEIVAVTYLGELYVIKKEKKEEVEYLRFDYLWKRKC